MNAMLWDFDLPLNHWNDTSRMQWSSLYVHHNRHGMVSLIYHDQMLAVAVLVPMNYYISRTSKPYLSLLYNNKNNELRGLGGRTSLILYYYRGVKKNWSPPSAPLILCQCQKLYNKEIRFPIMGNPAMKHRPKLTLILPRVIKIKCQNTKSFLILIVL